VDAGGIRGITAAAAAPLSHFLAARRRHPVPVTGNQFAGLSDACPRAWACPGAVVRAYGAGGRWPYRAPGLQVPFNIFTPQILDDSGAKLSKTIYLTKGAYADMPPAWASMQAFQDRFGTSSLTMLWDEISGWVSSPARFFRNYTVGYLEHVFSQTGSGTASAVARAS
jgi:hypothetical protein